MMPTNAISSSIRHTEIPSNGISHAKTEPNTGSASVIHHGKTLGIATRNSPEAGCAENLIKNSSHQKTSFFSKLSQTIGSLSEGAETALELTKKLTEVGSTVAWGVSAAATMASAVPALTPVAAPLAGMAASAGAVLTGVNKATEGLSNHLNNAKDISNLSQELAHRMRDDSTAKKV